MINKFFGSSTSGVVTAVLSSVPSPPAKQLEVKYGSIVVIPGKIIYHKMLYHKIFYHKMLYDIDDHKQPDFNMAIRSS